MCLNELLRYLFRTRCPCDFKSGSRVKCDILKNDEAFNSQECFFFSSVLVCHSFRPHAVDSAQLIIKDPLAVIKCLTVIHDYEAL